MKKLKEYKVTYELNWNASKQGILIVKANTPINAKKAAIKQLIKQTSLVQINKIEEQ